MNKQLLVILFVAGICFPGFSQDQVSLLIGDIKNGPSIYLSPQAVAYYERTGQVLSSGNRDDALRSYRAAIKLGDLGSGALAAIPTLIEQFPRAIHVSEIKNAHYAGEGLFEDWKSTYVMNEKNKFMLTSPFLDYNSMSMCENYIEATPEVTFIERSPASGPVIKSATVDITITFTFYIGTCALSRISGVTLGNLQNDWRLWWSQNGANGINPAASDVSPSPKAITSGQTFSDIVVNGKYRMSLTTGAELLGSVESKDDTSLIFETTEGKAFVFSKNLIERYDLIELPKTAQKQTPQPAAQVQSQPEQVVISFDDLLQKNRTDMQIEVRISNGSVFKGTLASIEQIQLKINVEGAIVPISKDIIKTITLILPPQATQSSTGKVDIQPTLPADTIITKSNKADDWGRQQPDVTLTGTIIKEDNSGITLKDSQDAIQLIKQADIVRVIKHTQDNFDEPIKRYAKPLNCPPEMILIDIKPGTQGRPYFKVCIDKFEYPNKEGTVPQGNISYSDGQKLCEQQGKRLCTADEWQWACSGIDGYMYPYGKALDETKCNTDASRALEPSGARVNCFSKFGVFDMVGNIFEWVSDSKNQPALMGGPYSKCQTVSPGVGGGAKPISGLRCCKSN